MKRTQNLLHKRFQKSEIDRLCYHKHICNIPERLLIGKLVNKTSWALNIKRLSPSACHSYNICGTLGEWLRYSGVTICRQIYQYDLVGLKKVENGQKIFELGVPLTALLLKEGQRIKRKQVEK